jgi:hypothetical protein
VSYSGFLFKVGDYIVSGKNIISADGISITKNVQDVDSYRDANGVLHREALDHAPIKVEFSTRNMLTDAQMQDFLSNVRRNYINEKERKVLATVYVPEDGDYRTCEMYMSTPTPEIYGVLRGTIYYKPMRLAFIQY